MKSLKNKVVLLFFMLFMHTVYPKVVQYAEDAYSMQAPQEIASITELTAELMDYTNVYEVVVPKKAGIAINPWNKFFAYGINPATKNPFIIINPEWFLPISPSEQQFLLARAFVTFEQGSTSLVMKIIPYLFIILSILLILLLFWLLGKINLINHKWLRVVIAIAIVTVCNFIFINQLQIQFIRHAGFMHDTKINKMALQKTADKQAAVKGLQHFDDSIKEELKKGELFWEPYKNIFGDYAIQVAK